MSTVKLCCDCQLAFQRQDLAMLVRNNSGGGGGSTALKSGSSLF